MTLTINSGLEKLNIAAIKNHIINNGKAYLIGATILAASGLALYIHSHVEEVSMIRMGNGRSLSMIDMAEPVVRPYDPTPVMRSLSALIQK